MARMHADELEIDEALVRRLLAEQFPEWADLPLSRVEPAGTVNAIFRLGDGLSLRLRRREGPKEPGGKEFDWLPRLAPSLPLEIPVPVAQGRPSGEYQWFWDVYTWVEGDAALVEEIDAIDAARDLAAFVAALQQVDAAGAPPGRGIPLTERDEEIRYWLARFDGDPAVTEEWERALAAPPWEGPPLWHHGDLDVRNWLVRGGRICAVIDWGSMGVGDPACDVMVAWKLHSREARDAFREALPTDDATWERARGWVLSQAVAALAYYTPENNPGLYHEAQSWLDLVLSERAERDLRDTIARRRSARGSTFSAPGTRVRAGPRRSWAQSHEPRRRYLEHLRPSGGAAENGPAVGTNDDDPRRRLAPRTPAGLSSYPRRPAMETTITPLLTVSDANAAVEYYKSAFAATEVQRHEAGGNRIVVEMKIDDAPFVVVDENADAFNYSPHALRGTSVRIALFVDDPDAVFERALSSGGKELFPMADQSYGLRQGRVEDPFGHHWMVSKPLDG